MLPLPLPPVLQYNKIVEESKKTKKFNRFAQKTKKISRRAPFLCALLFQFEHCCCMY